MMGVSFWVFAPDLNFGVLKAADVDPIHGNCVEKCNSTQILQTTPV